MTREDILNRLYTVTLQNNYSQILGNRILEEIELIEQEIAAESTSANKE